MSNPSALSTVIVDILIARMNALVYNQEIAADVWRLIEARVACSETTADHPTIQATPESTFGFLGLLNGIVGAMPDGYGLIIAIVENDKLTGFRRTSAWTLEQADASPVVSSVVGAVVADILRDDHESIDQREAAWMHPHCPWWMVVELANRSLSRAQSDAGSTS